MREIQPLPKLVASDIGGTLIRGSDIVPGFTASVLNRLVEINVPVVLITGYNHDTTLRYVRNLDPNIILMPQNGTICLRGNEKIWEYGMNEEEAREIFQFLYRSNLPVIIYKGKAGGFKNYVVSPSGFSVPGPFEEITEFTDFTNITGISTLVPNFLISQTRPRLEELIGDKFQLAYSQQEPASWLEVLQHEVRKDLALKRLCREWEIPLEDVIYFGDNFNDLEAFRLVGHPVLVENAVPELKDEFDYVVGSVRDQGVAHFLNQCYGLGIKQ